MLYVVTTYRAYPVRLADGTRRTEEHRLRLHVISAPSPQRAGELAMNSDISGGHAASHADVYEFGDTCVHTFEETPDGWREFDPSELTNGVRPA